ncbi:MAG: carbohydrate ABC transporter permease [Chloroflexota bacterium]
MRGRDFALMVTPAVLLMTVLLSVPLLYTIVWSFQHVSYGEGSTWVGLGNYSAALRDPVFRDSVLFTVVFTVARTILLLAVGYGLALLLNAVRRERSAFLGLMLVPFIVPSIIGAMAFSWLFDSNFGGLANYFLQKVIGHGYNWFTDPWANRAVLIGNVIWHYVPLAVLILLAALQGIPQEPMEAASLDGASWRQKQWHVVLPALRPMLRFLALISVMDGLRMFDQLIPLSPSAQTINNQSVMLYVYQRAFTDSQQNLGLGSAVNVLMLFTMIVLVIPLLRSTYREVKAS